MGALKQQPLAQQDRDIAHRRKLYRADNIAATISNKLICYQASLIDFTPHGVGLFIPEISFCKIQKCDLIRLKIHHSGGDVIAENQGYVAFLAKHTLGSTDGYRLGISFLAEEDRRSVDMDIRQNHRFSCPEYFRPTAFCEDKIFFNEYLFFQVINFSSKGMQIKTSLRNKSLFPGMIQEFTLNMPMHGIFKVRAKITYVRKEGNDYLVGASFAVENKAFLSSLSEYLFATSNVTLRDIKKSGLPVHGIEKALSFSYPSSAVDWDEIAALRMRSYQAAGKFGDVDDPQKTIDEFDAYSRHIICKVHRKIIAAGRVVFVNGDKERSEHYKLGVAVPQWVWNHQVCEFSRACTHPSYRGGDIFINLLRQFGRVAYQGGAKIVLANCNDNLWPLYKKVGFKKMGVKFDAFGTQDCHLIYTDIHKLFKGQSGSFLGWNQVVYPIASFVNRTTKNGFLSKATDLLNKYLYKFIRKYKFYNVRKRK